MSGRAATCMVLTHAVNQMPSRESNAEGSEVPSTGPLVNWYYSQKQL